MNQPHIFIPSSVTHKVQRVEFQIPREQLAYFTILNSGRPRTGLHQTFFSFINGLPRVTVEYVTLEAGFVLLFCHRAATGGSRSLGRTVLPKTAPRHRCVPGVRPGRSFPGEAGAQEEG